MKCPSCHKADLVTDVRTLTHSYKGNLLEIPDVRGQFCPACDEAVLDADTSRRVSSAMVTFNKQVNAAFVEPTFIGKVRKKLGLDQRQAGQIFGGGVNAFSRYETGKTKPPLPLLQLLFLLDRHPELLEEIKAGPHVQSDNDKSQSVP